MSSNDLIERAKRLKQKMVITEDIRTKVYDDLANAMLKALQEPSSPFNAEDAKDSADFIATTLDNVKDYAELSTFLVRLKTRWIIYEEACDKWLFPGQK